MGLLRTPPVGQRRAQPAAVGRRLVGQPVPLHRLPAHPGRRPAHVRARRHAAGPGERRRCLASAGQRPAATPGHRLCRAAHAAQLRRAACRAAASAHPGRQHRHGVVGDQAVPRPARADLHRRREGTPARRGRGRRRAHRRGGVAASRLADPGGALAGAARCVAAFCLAAHTHGRHHGRQRGQRLAHRRFGPGADGAERQRGAAPWRATAPDAAGRLLHRLHAQPPGAG